MQGKMKRSAIGNIWAVKSTRVYMGILVNWFDADGHVKNNRKQMTPSALYTELFVYGRGGV